jgi:multiple sugar transport system substrate-binding protein
MKSLLQNRPTKPALAQPQRQPSPACHLRVVSKWRLALLLCCTLFLSGCGDLRERAVARWPFGNAAVPTSSVPSAISLLGWAGSADENAQLQQAIQTFEASHINWRVAGLLVPNYTNSLSEALASDAPPDLFLAYSHQLADLVAKEHLLPIPPSIPVATSIAPNLVDGLQVNGQNYCFPRDVALLSLFYNRALFDRVEAPYPTNSWGWSDLRAALDATADMNSGFYSMALDYDLSRFYPFLLQSSSDDDIWQGPDAIAALDYFMDLYNDGLAVEAGTLDSTWNGEAFGRGRAAMTIEANWLVGYLANEFPALDYGIVELPAGSTGRATTAFISCWVINAATTKPAATLELAQFLTSPSVVSAWAEASNNLPPTLEQATTWVATHPTYAPFVAALPSAQPWTGPEGFVTRSEAVNMGMRMWYNDEMTTPDLISRLASMSDQPLLPIPTSTPSTPSD